MFIKEEIYNFFSFFCIIIGRKNSCKFAEAYIYSFFLNKNKFQFLIKICGSEPSFGGAETH